MKITAADVQTHVANHFGVDPWSLKSPMLSPVQREAREVAIYLSRALAGAEYEAIGRRFRITAHEATDARLKLLARLVDNDELADRLDELRREILSQPQSQLSLTV